MRAATGGAGGVGSRRHRDVSGGEEGFRAADIVDCEGNVIQLYEWYQG
jgi:hypothetical protein